MKDLVPSLIRTYVPLALAYVFGFLASLGVEVSGDTKLALSGAIGTVLAAAYYTIVRKLEKKFPQLSVLLGSSVQPASYTTDGEAHGKHAAPDEA